MYTDTRSQSLQLVTPEPRGGKAGLASNSSVPVAVLMSRKACQVPRTDTVNVFKPNNAKLAKQWKQCHRAPPLRHWDHLLMCTGVREGLLPDVRMTGRALSQRFSCH